MRDEDIKGKVIDGYAKIAKESRSCCLPMVSCCGGTNLSDEIGKKIGYSEEDLKAVPEGANLGLGCGNPVALASLREGETVLDLGSGAGFDCFLAAKRVGKSGKVIGVDMTPEMVERARENAKRANYENVEFRLGEIEDLPLDDGSVDAIISNCVINLSPDKGRVFKEAFRVLKPGGRIMISDIVVLKELPDFIRNSIEAYIGCLAGAVLKEEYLKALKEAGFKDIRIIEETPFQLNLIAHDPTLKRTVQSMDIPPEEIQSIADSVRSIKVSARKQ